jgi:hypothetical protein
MMRTANRNKVPFWYALYEGKQPLYDEYGNETSEYTVIYSNPVACEANISAARGETQTRQFGDDVSYDKVIVMGSDAPPIDEYSVLWLDVTPELDQSGALARDENDEIITPHNYIVRKVGRSLSAVSYAVSKVTVS